MHGLGTKALTYSANVDSTWVTMKPNNQSILRGDMRIFIFVLLFIHPSASLEFECVLSVKHCAWTLSASSKLLRNLEPVGGITELGSDAFGQQPAILI